MADMSPSDAILLAKNSEDGFGNSWFGMIIVLFFLVYGMGGMGFGGAANAVATSNEVQRGFDNQNSMANQREILTAVNGVGAQGVAATNQVFHDMLGVFNDKYGELQRDISGLAVGQANQLAKQNECCCQTLRAIDGVNYNIAMQTAQINANIDEKVNGLEKTMMGYRMADQEDRIRRLEQELSMVGVVRYPMAYAYNAGPSPFCGCGCPGNV